MFANQKGKAALAAGFMLPALAAPARAHATVAAVATEIQSLLLAGFATFAVLAVMVIGYFYLTGRGSMQSILPVVTGIAMLGAVGTITGAAAEGDPAALAGLFTGWLRGAAYAFGALFVVIAGYQYWFGRGSYQLLIPIVVGLIIVLSADWIVGSIA